MFTPEYLKSLATAISFSRGNEYFRAGSVGRLTRTGSTFTATVHGTHPYKVQLTMQAGTARLTCNCPYDSEGICKHAVALGVAVLREFGPDLTVSGAAASSHAFSPTALEAALRDAPASAQLAFLGHSATQETAPAAPLATASIDSISTGVYKALANLAFDDELLNEYAQDYLDYRCNKDDGLLAAAAEAIDEVLLPHAETVADALHAGHLTEALRHWVGVYEGSSAAIGPAADAYDLFGYAGYPAHVQARWLALLADQNIPNLLEAKDFAASESKAALELLAEHYCEPASAAAELANQEPKNTLPRYEVSAAHTPPPGLGAPLRIPLHFHDLLHALAHTPATAAQLRPLLTETPAPSLGLARVLLRVAEVLTDDALWLRTTETLAAHDATLTVQLLDHYRARSDRASLLRVLHERRARFTQVLNSYILQHLTPAEDEALYLAALEQRCCLAHSLPDYRVLQGYWPPAQRRAFIEEQLTLGQRTGNNPLFGAELLVAENRSAELLPYLLRLNWQWQRSVPELLALAAPAHPGDCLDAVMERTETLLQAPANDRGRTTYQRIASWLTALATVAELRPPVALFAAYLYTEYARLNALREELRAARLVRTQLLGKQHRLLVSEAEDEEVRALLRDKQGPKKYPLR